MPARAISQAIPLIALFGMFEMKGHQTKIFRLLMDRPMTIKQLEKVSKMSERMIRTYLGDLIEKNFIKRNIIEDRRLKYVYSANPPKMIINLLKDTISRIERAV